MSDDLMHQTQINLTEWLLAEGEILVKGEWTRVPELLLGVRGPQLGAGQRDWLEQLARIGPIDRSPRSTTSHRARRSPANGLERVKGLLRRYEDAESRMAAQQGRREISYEFLWGALGVKRS